MKTCFSLLLFSCLFYKESFSQGYLGKHQYAAVEILHPATGAKNFQLSYGVLFNRYYAFDIQLSYNEMNIDLYNRYAVYQGYTNGVANEYRMGQLKINGLGARLTYRTFNNASHKAAPVGWYMNYAVEYMHGSIKNDLVRQTSEGFDPAGNFITNNTPFKLREAISFYSFIFTPGRTIPFYKSFYLDLGLDIGLRRYVMHDAEWKLNGFTIYNIESPFKNNINKYYQYKSENDHIANDKSELIYEPVIKIGYLF